MTTTHASSQVCIRKKNGYVVGAGFLVDEQHILTCAHVVAEALEWSDGEFSPDPPKELVFLDFPLLNHNTILKAKVVFWQPAREDWSGGDIAGLQLIEDAPIGAEVVRFVLAEDVWNHSFRVFGFPKGQDNGVWASGRLLDRQASNWIQIETDRTGGFSVIPGFSGGAVWDEQLEGVVGMVVASIIQPETKGAFVIPLDVLLMEWSLIKPTTRQRIFLSAADADIMQHQRMRADLEARGILVWDEQHGPVGRSSTPEPVRHQAIRAALALVVIITSKTSSSLIVREHLRLAQLYQKRVVFVWMGEEERDPEPDRRRDLIWVDAHGSNYANALQIVREALSERTTISGLLEVLNEPSWNPRNPYIGLRAFTARETNDFFGRERFIDQLCSEIQSMINPVLRTNQHKRMLTIIGPSGSGKSSVVMAGLLPQLMQRDDSKSWVYLNRMVPGKDPIGALVDVLHPYFPNTDFETQRNNLIQDTTNGLHRLTKQLADQQERISKQKTYVVLFIDQFEELFTLTLSEEQRKRFLDLIETAVTEPEGQLIVILTLRADFYHRLLENFEFYKLIEPTLRPLLPLEIEELRSTIVQPAAQPDVQLIFEGNLVGDLLFEVQGQVGALPLLQFTLQQLFEHRIGHRLTQQAYRNIGKVSGALAKYAEETYQGLPSDDHRRLARMLFLRLIEIGNYEQSTTRRRAALSEFVFDDLQDTRLMRETIDHFVTARLLTTNATTTADERSETTIEVSHEALIREWPLLANWLLKAREDISLQHDISMDAAEWERRGKHNDRLYRGSQLREARLWATRNTPSKNEAAFLRASNTSVVRSRVILIVLSLLVVSIIGLLAQPLLQPGLISLRYSLFPSHTVFNVLDGEPGSLRATIADAPPGSIIIFDSSLKGHSLVLTRGNLIINKNLTILGLGEKDLILNGNGAKYHLQVNQGITVTIRGLTLTSFNSSAIKNYGTLNLVSSLVTHNRTDGNGGGIENFETGILTLEDTTVSNNAALSDDMAFIPNNVFENGGGIYNQGTLTIKNSVIVGNTARKDGGGIVNGEYSSSSTPPDQRTVTATIINSWILSNQACVVGGGIVNGEHSGMAKLNLLNSNVSFNQAGTCLSKQNTSIFGGGGIYSSTHASELTMKNSTISRNIAYHSSGTGISILGGQSTMIFCTVYENGSTGAAIAVVGGSLIMTNSIASQDRSQAISGSLTSGGYNLIQDNSGTKLKSTQPVAHDLIGVSPLLGPVPSNGGPIPLKPGGLAIDYIPINACHIDDSISDERGMPRPDNNEQNCDIGAYESSF